MSPDIVFYQWLCPHLPNASSMDLFFDEPAQFTAGGDSWTATVAMPFPDAPVQFQFGPSERPRPLNDAAQSWSERFQLAPQCVRDPSGDVTIDSDKPIVLGVMIGIDGDTFAQFFGAFDWERVAADLSNSHAMRIQIEFVEGCEDPLHIRKDIRRDPLGTLGPVNQLAATEGLVAVARVCPYWGQELDTLGVPNVDVLLTSTGESATVSYAYETDERDLRETLLFTLDRIAEATARSTTRSSANLVVSRQRLTEALDETFVSAAESDRYEVDTAKVIREMTAAVEFLRTTNLPPMPDNVESAQFGAALDGDTINVRTADGIYDVRLILIDTPELTATPECHAREATTVVELLLEVGGPVLLERDVSETDRYGRLLRYVYQDSGWMVNEILVAAGAARVTAFPPDTKYQARFERAEEFAQTQGLGLWGHC